MRKTHATLLVSVSVLAVFLGLSGCRKDTPAPVTPEATEAVKDVQANDAQQPANSDDNAGTDVQAQAIPTPPPMPDFNEESLAKAKARAEARYKKMPCPKGAKFKDGTCVCPAANGIDAERKKCALKPKAYPLFSSDFKCVPNFWECFQTVMCVNPNGCHTADGLHYGPYYEEGYIVGGVDTAVTAYNRWDGDAAICVLDRTDGIPLFSARPGNDVDFACDEEFCPCASDTCILGELCKAGACIPDNSPLPVLDDSNSANVFADSLPLYIDGMPDKTFDTTRCKGGRLYCHGVGMRPVLKPHESYKCAPVASLPGLNRSGLMAWVCDDDECPCGDTKCHSDEVCTEGTCYKP
jgi:hypothetical protein